LKRLDWQAFGLWVMVTLLGSLAGLVVGYITAALFAYRLGDWTVYALFGLVFGLVAGFAQSLVLGRWVAQPTGWIPVTAFGEAVVFGGFAFRFYIGASLWDSLEIGGIAVSVLGTVQWLFLRRHVAKAAWWIPATMSGRVLGAILLFGVVHDSDFGFGAILALQTPPALITGATLSVLFHHTERLFPPEISPRPLGL
jgi:hypothetical protein